MPAGPPPPAGSPAPKRTLQIPGYRILKVLGRGGQGIVVQAIRKSDQRPVAIKVLAPAVAKVSVLRARFRREGGVALALKHPNIVAGIAAGQADGLPYLVFEYVDGISLTARLELKGPLDEGEALAILRQMADALAYAHGQGLVHRDIKPDNILLTRDGTAKLLDLGLAKDLEAGGELTAQGTVFGTLGYMSPEAALDTRSADTRRDLYSLGATFYRAVVGEPPFPADSLSQAIRRMTEEDPEPPHTRVPGLSEPFSALLCKLLSRDPDARPQTPEELLADLDRVEAGEMPAGVRPARRGCFGWLVRRR